MTFYERYIMLCDDRRIDPCSKSTADALDVSKATISLWGKNDNVPKGDTIAKMADLLHVSADYLLGRTDNPRSYAEDHPSEDQIAGADLRLLKLIQKLDDKDKGKLENLISGMLMADKYEAQS